MSIILDHTIVPSHDKEASARFFADIFGLTYGRPAGALRASESKRHPDVGLR